jgi:hypothetical protein
VARSGTNPSGWVVEDSEDRFSLGDGECDVGLVGHEGSFDRLGDDRETGAAKEGGKLQHEAVG